MVTPGGPFTEYFNHSLHGSELLIDSNSDQCASRPMADKRVVSRMSKEMERLRKEPPHGVTCWPKEGRLNHLEVKLLGEENTPYAGGVFNLEIKIPNRYPFEPPHVQFLTQIYHPNIDTAGRICLDVLKSPPTGSWKPAHNLHTILTSIQLLLAEPNPDDGLMADISSEYKHQKPMFLSKAKEWTTKYARNSQLALSSCSAEPDIGCVGVRNAVVVEMEDGDTSGQITAVVSPPPMVDVPQPVLGTEYASVMKLDKKRKCPPFEGALTYNKRQCLDK